MATKKITFDPDAGVAYAANFVLNGGANFIANFDPIFIPFPGWKNLNNQGNIIEVDQSDGRPDKFVPLEDVGKFKSNELQFREYTFTAKDLPTFKNYRVKFILTSSNQTWVPRVSDLRVITLA